MNTKLCTLCQEEKPLEAFGKNKHNSSGLSARCKECTNKRSRETYYKDPKKNYTRTRQYHLDHPEWSKQRLRSSHELHAEERYERQKIRLKDPVKRDKAREASRRSESRRRAIKRAGVADLITSTQISELLEKYKNCCYICNTEFSDTVELHLDHYMPIAKGGQHTLNNLRPACSSCNTRKNSIWPITDEILIRIKNATLEQRARCA